MSWSINWSLRFHIPYVVWQACVVSVFAVYEVMFVSSQPVLELVSSDSGVCFHKKNWTLNYWDSLVILFSIFAGIKVFKSSYQLIWVKRKILNIDILLTDFLQPNSSLANILLVFWFWLRTRNYMFLSCELILLILTILL